MASKVDEMNRQPRSHHRQIVDNTEPTLFENIHRYLRSHHRQMVDDTEPKSFQNIHRYLRSHHRQMVDDAETTSFENIHRYLRSHHRQMVDNPEPTSFENIHRVAAVATGRRCEMHEKISPALSIARCWTTQNRRPSKTSTAIFVATIARW
jgi:hypothetical protein